MQRLQLDGGLDGRAARRGHGERAVGVHGGGVGHVVDRDAAEGDRRGTEIDTRETIGSGERHRDVGD